MISELVMQESSRLGIDPGVAQAVLQVESGGDGFNKDGSLKIRFEPHIFDPTNENDQRDFADYFQYEPGNYYDQMYRKSKKAPWRRIHGSQKDEHAAMNWAAELTTRTRALRATSMGSAQIMGFNHRVAGYNSPQEMFDAFQKSGDEQVRGFFRYLENRGLIETLRARDLKGFARAYNGPGLVDTYSKRMQEVLSQLEGRRE